MVEIKTHRSFLATAIASIILAGCGGGGGGSGSTPSGSTSSSSSSSVAANKAPVFTSAASAKAVELSLATGYSAIATDANGDTLNYSLNGGADKDLFSLDSATGVLSFKVAPDFTKPGDATKDNIYEIQLKADDGHGGTVTQNLQVIVSGITRLLSLNKTTESIVAGTLITADSSCNLCDPAATRYEWYLEGKDTPVFTGKAYSAAAPVDLKKITLKVTPYTQAGKAGKTESLVLQRNHVVDFIFRGGVGINAAFKADGTALFWGSYIRANGKSSVDFSTNIDRVFAGGTAMAVLKSDGTVVTLGYSEYGGDSTGKDLTSVKNIVNNYYAFAALKTDGTVVTWGHGYGGYSTGIDLTNVKHIFSWGSSFTALKADGSWVTWGYSSDKGTATGINLNLIEANKIFFNGSAFAALKADGSVITWGNSMYGGDSTGKDLTGVKQILSNRFTFTALKTDGSVVTWGDLESGEDSANKALTNVKQIFSNGDAYGNAFAALKADGSVTTWGDANYGGDSTGKELTNVKQIFSTGSAFAALKSDGSVVTWGSAAYGGDSTGINLVDVKQIVSSTYAFAALKSDGTVLNWGGYNRINTPSRSLAPIVNVFGGGEVRFGAVQENGDAFVWGDNVYGGDGASDIDLTAGDYVTISNSLTDNK